MALVPKANLPKQKIEGLQVIGVERIDEAMMKVREFS
jgi:DNA repair protein RadA/Sms